ncbi:MAG: PAS domain S-box protein [Thermomicrobiales bacterium]
MAMEGDALVTPMSGSLAAEPHAALLRAMVHSAMDAILALDGEQRIVAFNPAAEQMFRCSAAEALGQPHDRFLPERYRGMHRQHVADFGATGDTTRSMGHVRPLRALRATGEEFPVEATIARVDVDGRPYYMAIVRDITARHAAEAALQRQVELLNLAYDAIVTWEWNGEITFWNAGAERLYGYASTEAVGRRIHDLLATRHAGDFAGIAATLERERVWEGEVSHRRRDGSEVLVESRHVLVEDQGGRYVLEANRDITERKRAEAALHESRSQLARELEDTKRLQAISSLLIEDDGSPGLYESIIDAAMAIMRAEFGSMQLLDPERNAFHPVAWRNVHPDAAAFSQIISGETGTSRGLSLHHGERLVVPDVSSRDVSPGDDSLTYDASNGITAVQSTPLTTRQCQLVGMITTGWRHAHTPGEQELRLLDILARQAADYVERRRVQVALRESEMRFRAFWEATTEAMVLSDADGMVRDANPAYEKLLGLDRADVLGRPFPVMLPPDVREGTPARYQDIFQAAEPVPSYESRVLHSSGAERIVESRAGFAVRDGVRVGMISALRDVTDRKHAEAERAVSLEREAVANAAAQAAASARDALQEIFDALPGGVLLMTAPNAGIEFANVAMNQLVWGADHASTRLPVYGQDFQFTHTDGAPLGVSERPGTRVLHGERVWNQQLLLTRADGTATPIAIHATRLRSHSQATGRAIVFVQDVTTLRQAEQLKDDFLALVSHELRTPLSVIHGGAQVLVNKPHLDEETRLELLRDVVAESARLERLLSNLLALTDITAGRLQAALEPVLLEPLITRIVADFQNRSAEHTFGIEMARMLPPAEADPDLLEEVVRNLYENAIKYAPHGGRVLTTAEVRDDAVVIRVTDEGIGIAPEHVARVFERFRRVGGDNRVRGMGLGLYLCRGLIDAQGGTIEASSPGLGQGSTFTVTLPIARGWTTGDHA